MSTKEFKVGSFWKTSCGRKARIVCNDVRGLSPILGLVQSATSNNEDIISFSESGKCYSTAYDLITPWEEPKPRRLAWICTSSGIGDGLWVGVVRLVSSEYQVETCWWERYPPLDEPEEKK